ncbi:Prolyl endopeptidase-like [Oryzias melastigma]|uniref:Prolyl endopeptidase n=1 Tax=Oryzias melastigma TaxID=30732 RepID=A0A834C3R2_ORYME|nr:Prolyl endopeptidase-like [Oryzias melastigma]
MKYQDPLKLHIPCLYMFTEWATDDVLFYTTLEGLRSRAVFRLDVTSTGNRITCAYEEADPEYVLQAPVSEPSMPSWVPLFVPDPGTVIKDMEVIGDHCVLIAAAPTNELILIVVPLTHPKEAYVVQLPSWVCSIETKKAGLAYEQQNVLEFLISSPVHPPVSYRLHPDKKLLLSGRDDSRTKKQDKYFTTRLEACSRDGTLVPVTLLHTAPVKSLRNAPLLVHVYGAYALTAHSAGAVPVGALCNRDPHMVQAVLLQAPFLDVLGSMENLELSLTLDDRDEWGDAVRHRQVLASYCPLNNIIPQRYPSMLLTAYSGDPRIPLAGVLKYTHLLKKAVHTHMSSKPKPEREPAPNIVLNIQPGANHLGPEDYEQMLTEEALKLAFLYTELGLDRPHKRKR